jgi:hypothetical protein
LGAQYGKRELGDVGGVMRVEKREAIQNCWIYINSEVQIHATISALSRHTICPV